MSLDVSIPLMELVLTGNVSFSKVYDEVLEKEVLCATIFHRNWGKTVGEVEVSVWNDAPMVHFNFYNLHGSSAIIRNILQDICKDIGIEYEEY
tara:strand:- start:50 stop:328 length:279 start_codon:yes stop_codon:yes gene_type:complete